MQAVERASRAGLIVVVAAAITGVNPTTGLPGYAGITSPGNAPSAITVGAARTGDTVARSDDRIPDYSSAGPTWYDAMVKPDVVAPGHNIVAVAAKQGAIYKAYPQLLAADPDYIRLSGTSMATAVTTRFDRAVARGQPHGVSRESAAHRQCREGHPAVHGGRDPQRPGARVRPSAQGRRRVEREGRIDFASSVDTSAPIGAPWLTASPFPWTTIGGESLTWNQGVIWGSAVIWGSTATFNETAWGHAVIWGSDVAWGNAVIWGSNLVWTDSQSWGNAVIWGSDAIGYTDGNAVIWGSTEGLTASSTAWKDVGGASTGSAATSVPPQ